MPTTTEVPDLTSDQLASLHDRMQAAKQERDDRERAEQGKRQQRRQAQAKLTRVCSEITKTETELSDKCQTRHMLKERRDELREHGSPSADLDARDELAALDQAIAWTEETGVGIIAGYNVPSSARPYRLIDGASPAGLNWSVPIAELERRLEALADERDRLETRLGDLEDDHIGAAEVAA